MSDSPNIPFGSEKEYPAKTAPYSRDILDWLKEVYAIVGEKGDKPAHEWSGTSLRFEQNNGTWGVYTDLQGIKGDNAPPVQIRYSADGTNWHTTYNSATDKYLQFSYNNGSTWDSAKIFFKGEKGDQGDPGNDLKIQYSDDGEIWSSSPTDPINYIRFSLDDGSTWQTAIYVRGTEGIDGTDAPAVIIQYSETGSSWHAIYNSEVDKYIRFSVNNGSTWLVNDKFIGEDGENGADGDSNYLYIAYADANDGTGFTMTFNSSKDYIAIKNTTSPISSPSVSDFSGLWKNYKGIKGDDGSSAYVYVGYASDDTGNNFSLIPSDSLDYMAVLSTSIYKNPPVQADFDGLWKKTRGNSGNNIYYIELPNAGTLSQRCDAIISQPVGWVIDSGDQITNPLSTNAIDLIINHGSGKEVIDVVIKSKTSDRQIRLMGTAAYNTFEDDNAKNYLCLKSFSETETILEIYIMFES